MGSWKLADRQPGLVMGGGGGGGGGEVDGGGQSPSRLASLYFASPLPGDGAIQYNSFSPFTHLSNAFTAWTGPAAILPDYCYEKNQNKKQSAITFLCFCELL